MAPAKTIRVKNNTNERFDGEIAEKIAVSNILFMKLSVDEILHKKKKIYCKL